MLEHRGPVWRHAPAALGTALLAVATVVGTQVALATVSPEPASNSRAPLSPYGEGGFTVGVAAVDKRITITSADDGSYVLGYSPAGGDVVLDLDLLSGDRAQPWWYDAGTGRTLKMAALASAGVARFPVPKEGGGPAWVLVVDDAGAGYGSPDREVVAQATGEDAGTGAGGGAASGAVASGASGTDSAGGSGGSSSGPDGASGSDGGEAVRPGDAPASGSSPEQGRFGSSSGGDPAGGAASEGGSSSGGGSGGGSSGEGTSEKQKSDKDSGDEAPGDEAPGDEDSDGDSGASSEKGDRKPDDEKPDESKPAEKPDEKPEAEAPEEAPDTTPEKAPGKTPKEAPKPDAPKDAPKAGADPSWDKLAQCESTGNWGINSGNGYYGGLQFDKATWSDFGGTAHAPRADQATKEQQIEVATKVRDARGGYSSWPACSSKLGLPK